MILIQLALGKSLLVSTSRSSMVVKFSSPACALVREWVWQLCLPVSNEHLGLQSIVAMYLSLLPRWGIISLNIL
jgi:hypothetical protein